LRCSRYRPAGGRPRRAGSRRVEFVVIIVFLGSFRPERWKLFRRQRRHFGNFESVERQIGKFRRVGWKLGC
jgi:hypothetical protein